MTEKEELARLIAIEIKNKSFRKVNKDNITVYLDEGENEIYLEKADAIAIAKHFGLLDEHLHQFMKKMEEVEEVSDNVMSALEKDLNEFVRNNRGEE